MNHYSVNDFVIYLSWDGDDRDLECPYEGCRWTGELEDRTLGELLNAAEAHLVKEHNND